MKILRNVAFLLVPAIIIFGSGSSLTSTEPTPIWDAQKLDEAFKLAGELGTTTLMLITKGEVVKSLDGLETPYKVHSVRKALLSALVGQHIGTGPSKINLDSTLAELGINDEPNLLTELQQQAKVLHLIKSVSGINHEAAGEGGLFKKEKDKRLGHKPNPPGTIWAYNNWDYNALTTIFEQETGMTIYEAFKKGIAEPLEMQDFNEDSVWYNFDKKLSIHPKAGFKMSARDLVKFGMLYLNKGKWNGKQIIPASWIERIANDYTLTGDEGMRSAHGYLWWLPVDQKSRDIGFPEGSFFASGFGSQRIFVIPAWDTVIVHQVDTSRIIGYLLELMKKRGYTFKEAAFYMLVECKKPEHSSSEFCRKSAWADNFINNINLVKILSEIFDARIAK